MSHRYQDAVAKKGDIVTLWGAIAELQKRIEVLETMVSDCWTDPVAHAFYKARREQERAAKEKAPVSEGQADVGVNWDRGML